MSLLAAVLFGVGTALPLVAGAAVAVRWRPSDRVVSFVLAFASGSLLTGLAFELFEPAFETAGFALATGGCLAGTGAYVGVKYLVEARGGLAGVPLLAAVVFDGLAENVTLGVALVATPTDGPLAILAGVAANNLPEAIGGASDMIEDGRSAWWTVGVWTSTAAALGLVVVAGYVGFSGVSDTTLAVVQATGGGAVLASLAVEIMPDAYEGGGPAVAFGTAAGFVLTFVLV